MCAQFTLKTSTSELAQHYGIALTQEYKLDLRILPYTAAPVIVNFNNKIQFQKMNFSLVPSWSKEPKVKFATHNARIETLTEKPSWKAPLISQRCLVPLSEFIESILEKKFAGNMIKISEIEDHILTAAGLWDAWTDPVTGKITYSFAIITDEPVPFIDEAGHDRCPVFLKKEAFAEWLDPAPKDPKKLIEFLKANKLDISFKADIDRPLKEGWQKRKP